MKSIDFDRLFMDDELYYHSNRLITTKSFRKGQNIKTRKVFNFLAQYIKVEPKSILCISDLYDPEIFGILLKKIKCSSELVGHVTPPQPNWGFNCKTKILHFRKDKHHFFWMINMVSDSIWLSKTTYIQTFLNSEIYEI